jgi:hypothetical protein
MSGAGGKDKTLMTKATTTIRQVVPRNGNATGAVGKTTQSKSFSESKGGNVTKKVTFADIEMGSITGTTGTTAARLETSDDVASDDDNRAQSSISPHAMPAADWKDKPRTWNDKAKVTTTTKRNVLPEHGSGAARGERKASQSKLLAQSKEIVKKPGPPQQPLSSSSSAAAVDSSSTDVDGDTLMVVSASSAQPTNFRLGNETGIAAGASSGSACVETKAHNSAALSKSNKRKEPPAAAVDREASSKRRKVQWACKHCRSTFTKEKSLREHCDSPTACHVNNPDKLCCSLCRASVTKSNAEHHARYQCKNRCELQVPDTNAVYELAVRGSHIYGSDLSWALFTVLRELPIDRWKKYETSTALFLVNHLITWILKQSQQRELVNQAKAEQADELSMFKKTSRRPAFEHIPDFIPDWLGFVPIQENNWLPISVSFRKISVEASLTLTHAPEPGTIVSPGSPEHIVEALSQLKLVICTLPCYCIRCNAALSRSPNCEELQQQRLLQEKQRGQASWDALFKDQGKQQPDASWLSLDDEQKLQLSRHLRPAADRAFDESEPSFGQSDFIVGGQKHPSNLPKQLKSKSKSNPKFASKSKRQPIQLQCSNGASGAFHSDPLISYDDLRVLLRKDIHYADVALNELWTLAFGNHLDQDEDTDSLGDFAGKHNYERNIRACKDAEATLKYWKQIYAQAVQPVESTTVKSLESQIKNAKTESAKFFVQAHLNRVTAAQSVLNGKPSAPRVQYQKSFPFGTLKKSEAFPVSQLARLSVIAKKHGVREIGLTVFDRFEKSRGKISGLQFSLFPFKAMFRPDCNSKRDSKAATLKNPLDIFRSVTDMAAEVWTRRYCLTQNWMLEVNQMLPWVIDAAEYEANVREPQWNQGAADLFRSGKRAMIRLDTILLPFDHFSQNVNYNFIPQVLAVMKQCLEGTLSGRHGKIMTVERVLACGKMHWPGISPDKLQTKLDGEKFTGSLLLKMNVISLCSVINFIPDQILQDCPVSYVGQHGFWVQPLSAVDYPIFVPLSMKSNLVGYSASSLGYEFIPVDKALKTDSTIRCDDNCNDDDDGDLDMALESPSSLSSKEAKYSTGLAFSRSPSPVKQATSKSETKEQNCPGVFQHEHHEIRAGGKVTIRIVGSFLQFYADRSPVHVTIGGCLLPGDPRLMMATQSTASAADDASTDDFEENPTDGLGKASLGPPSLCLQNSTHQRISSFYG